jgi:hypothetical protein
MYVSKYLRMGAEDGSSSYAWVGIMVQTSTYKFI